MQHSLVFFFAVILHLSHLLHLDASIHPFRLPFSSKPFLLIPMSNTTLPHTAWPLSFLHQTVSTLKAVAVTHSLWHLQIPVDCQACNRKSKKIYC
ncbi:prion protein (testis specific) [Homo sapiens]|uniref:Putative testis-specific prion protein n=1 Tax=Homo sapiens TaxID=9606 RepID=PRNT_HUMAN